MDLSCIVLTGGKGTRLGRQKTRVTVGKKTLFQRVLSSIEFLKSDIIVVTSGKEQLLPADGCPGYRMVADIYSDKGPLVGIFTGLNVSKTTYNLVVATDMPFLSQGLLGYMVQLSAGFDVVMPRLKSLIEPLHAVYARTCLESIEAMIQADDLNIRGLLERVRVRYVEDDEINHFDPGHLSFFNINTPADLERAQEIAGRESSP